MSQLQSQLVSLRKRVKQLEIELSRQQSQNKQTTISQTQQQQNKQSIIKQQTQKNKQHFDNKHNQNQNVTLKNQTQQNSIKEQNIQVKEKQQIDKHLLPSETIKLESSTIENIERLFFERQIRQLEEKRKDDSLLINGLKKQLQFLKNQNLPNLEVKSNIQNQSKPSKQTSQQLDFTSSNLDKASQLVPTKLQSKVYQQKYYNQIAKNNEYLQQLSSLKSQLKQKSLTVKSIQKQNQKLQQKLSNNFSAQNYQKSTKQTEVNTQPVRFKDSSKKSVLNQSPLISPLDTQLVKQNEILQKQFAKKQDEYKRLLNKIDEIQKQNNKLIGIVESFKRDNDNDKQTIKILQQNFQEQKNVIESQKSTLKKLEQQHIDSIQQYQNQIEYMNQKIATIQNKIITPIEQTQNDIYLDLKHKKSSRKVESKQCSDQQQVTTPTEICLYNIAQYQPNLLVHSAQIHSNKLNQKRTQQSISPTRQEMTEVKKQLHKPIIKKLAFDKLQKKVSSNTFDIKAQVLKRNQDIQTKTISARGIKSSRVLTPQDLKIGIKGILQNSVLLGKGVDSIEMIISVVKLIESFSDCPYQDILHDLEKKKQVQKAAFNNNLMKQIMQIAKVKQQYQQRIQQSKQQDKQLLRQKQQLINQLRLKQIKLQAANEELKQKNQLLVGDLDKIKKIENQKQVLIVKNNETQQFSQKVRQQKRFLLEKVTRYQQYINEYDSIKRKMFSENQKQKNQLLWFKSQYKKLQSQFHQLLTLKKSITQQFQYQSNELFEILIQSQLVTSKKNKQLTIQIMNKQSSLNSMAQQIDVLKQKLKQRQIDFLQIGKQVHAIRAANLKLQLDQNGQSITLLKQEQTQLKTQLKNKQQTLAMVQKELYRHKNQIILLQKQIQGQKQKSKNHAKQKRQLTNQIGSLKNLLDNLQKKLAYKKQEDSYLEQKSSNEFEEVMEKIFLLRKRQKQNRKVKTHLNPIKTVSSTRLQYQETSSEKMIKQYNQMKGFLKLITETIYQAYGSLPLTSESTTLFLAENKQQLLNQLKDIQKFAEQYVYLKTDIDNKSSKTEQAYIGLAKSLTKRSQDVSQQQLIKLIEDIKIGKQQQQKLKQIIPLILSSKDLAVPPKKKKMSIQLDI